MNIEPLTEWIDERSFGIVWGVLCALWTGFFCWMAFVRRYSVYLRWSIVGPLAYLAWLIYGLLRRYLDITSVAGVLFYLALAVVVGVILGRYLGTSKQAR